MSLKLFRSTGYSSFLSPGETRVAMHPGWLVLATSAWIGLACNVALWRELAGLISGGDTRLPFALAGGLAVAGGCGALLSLLGWRRTLKPSATVLLFIAALAACGVWSQSLTLDASLFDKRLAGLMPAWPSLLRWQAPALLVVLGLLPALWVWHTQVRRLPGPQQLAANVTGMTAGVGALAAAVFVLMQGLV